MKLIFSRNVTALEFFLGKMLAITKVLLMILAAAVFISLISAEIFHVLTFANMLHILGFYGISFLYMFGFAIFSLAITIRVDSAVKSMLYALFVWIVITFALPELVSALHPTASLNPVLPPTNILQSPILSVIHQFFYPISISEHFKEMGSFLLGVLPAPTEGQVSYPQSLHFFILILWEFLIIGFAFLFFQKIRPAENALSE